MDWSKKFDLSRAEGKRILKYLAWGVVYSLIAGAIAILANLNVPTEWAFILPIATVMLTNAGLAVRKFMTDTTT